MKFIENNTNLMIDEISRDIDKYSRVFIAVAFVRDSGVNLIISKMEKKIQEGADILLLFGNDLGITELDSIKQLLAIGVKIKIYSGSKTFHIKTYIFSNDSESEVIIGSSNISNSGLKEGVEWNLSINSNDANASAIVHQIIDEFFSLWRSENSIKVTPENIDTFKNEFKLENVSKKEDNIQEIKQDMDIKTIIDKKRDYIQTRYPEKIWTFQLYLNKLEEKKKKFGTEFNIVVFCEKGSPNEVIFVIPYSYLESQILPYADLYSDKNCYYYNISSTYRFNWQHGIGMDGNKFRVKKHYKDSR